MCSCVLTLLSSFAVVCSDFSLCAQAFACVLKLPKRLPMCANVQQPTQRLSPSSGPQTVKLSTGREQLSSGCAGISQRCLLGILWVTCKCSLGCLPCDRAFGRRPCWDPRGSELLPCAGAFLTRGDSVTPCPIPQSTPHRDLHHESMSLKIRSQFQQIRSTIGLKSS